jgi:hypothetical protein
VLNRPDDGTTVVYNGPTDTYRVNGMIYRVAVAHAADCHPGRVALELKGSRAICTEWALLEPADSAVARPPMKSRGEEQATEPVDTDDTEIANMRAARIRERGDSMFPPPSGFTTKDSGERATFASGMVRDTNAGKARFDLLLAENVSYGDQFLTRVAELFARGADKYHDRNWEQANSTEELSRMRESAFRHFVQWASGDRDEDHAAAVVFNLLAFETTKSKMDREGRA